MCANGTSKFELQMEGRLPQVADAESKDAESRTNQRV